MLRRSLLLIVAAPLFSADSDFQGQWLWEEKTAIPGDGWGIKRTYFEFQNRNGVWTGTKRGRYIVGASREVLEGGGGIEAIRNIRVRGVRISFRTGELQWEGASHYGDLAGFWISDDGNDGAFLFVRAKSK